MKTGRSLEQIAQELIRQRDSKRDFVADTRKLEFAPVGDNQIVLRGLPIGEAPLRRIAHQQFSTETKIPKVYYDRMLQESPDLLSRNLNHWLHAEPANRLVRTIDGEVRACLSDRYRPLDNYDLAMAVLPTLAKSSAQVISTEITEDRFYIKATTDRIRGDVKRGDTIQAGLVVQNSEVGRGALSIAEMHYRLVCLNGMIRGVEMRKTHLGDKQDFVTANFAQEYFRTRTRELRDEALWNEVADVATAMFDQARLDAHLEQYRIASEVTISKPMDAVEIITDRFALGESEKDNVLQHLISGGDLSLWGLANAVTRTAEDIDDYDRATEFEALGSKVLELPQSAWKAAS